MLIDNDLSPGSATSACFTRAASAASSAAEIVAVIATLVILTGLIVPKIMSGPDEAKRVIAKQDIGTIMQALELYRRDHGRYPTQEPGLRGEIDVFSYGADGKRGGEGDDADIGSWE
jgi:general secretion pathway protein G